MSEGLITESGNHPLVSCIMPTFNRRRFVPRAIEYFLRQDYESKELVIVDDGTDSIDDIVPDDKRIRYFRLEKKLTVGAKRNFACEHALGEIIVHWDDDDWHARRQLSFQVTGLLKSGKSVCGINELLFYDIAKREAWRYRYPLREKLWISGSSMCYKRKFWDSNRFADIDVGEDGRFVWTAKAGDILVLSDNTFHVGIIHGNNVSPKQTHGSYWARYSLEDIMRLFGGDRSFYEKGEETNDIRLCAGSDPGPSGAGTQLRNVFACLVHESQECVVDLVRNLKYLDPTSTILLYNGGSDRDLLNRGFPFERYGALLVPDSRRLSWGKLHDFAIACMKFALDHLQFDTLTIVDSDQLAVRHGYSKFLSQFLTRRPRVGLLGNSPGRQLPATRIPPAMAAFKEKDLWLPFLRRFDRGEEKFVHWSFWPSTVFTSAAARDLVDLFETDVQLGEIMQRSQLWATEEVIFPTLASLLGYEIGLNPCSYDFVKYRQPYTVPQIDAALSRADVYWIHPVARQYDNYIRRHIRNRFGHYTMGTPIAGEFPLRNDGHARLLSHSPVLDAMRNVEGWLEEDEAELIITTAENAIGESVGVPELVELGSLCGRATVVMGNVVKSLRPEAKVHAIDPQDGRVGALDTGIRRMPFREGRLAHNISAAGISDCVNLIRGHPSEVVWEKRINLLLIDSLHDYVNVARDFFRYEPFVVPGGYILFHDYADYFPGVKAFVNEILASGNYQRVRCVRSLMVMRKSLAELPTINKALVSRTSGNREKAQQRRWVVK